MPDRADLREMQSGKLFLQFSRLGIKLGVTGGNPFVIDPLHIIRVGGRDGRGPELRVALVEHSQKIGLHQTGDHFTHFNS